MAGGECKALCSQTAATMWRTPKTTITAQIDALAAREPVDRIARGKLMWFRFGIRALLKCLRLDVRLPPGAGEARESSAVETRREGWWILFG
jgi:hypothetical protein